MNGVYYGQTLTSAFSEHLRIKSQANKAGKGFKVTDTAIVVASDFEKYCALLETEYEQLLSDINDEIAKQTQKVEEMQTLTRRIWMKGICYKMVPLLIFRFDRFLK